MQKLESHFAAKDRLSEPEYDNSQKSLTALMKHLSISGTSSHRIKGLKAVGAVIF